MEESGKCWEQTKGLDIRRREPACNYALFTGTQLRLGFINEHIKALTAILYIADFLLRTNTALIVSFAVADSFSNSISTVPSHKEGSRGQNSC